MHTIARLSAALALVCALSTLAGAQESKPTSQPTSADVLAKLLLAAQDKQLLEHRLFTKRHYMAEERRGKVILMVGEGKETSEGLQFSLSAEALGEGETIRLIYDFTPSGYLRRVRFVESSPSRLQPARKRERIMDTVIAKGVATQTRIDDGVTRPDPSQGPWTGDRVSLFSALVLLPALADLGLPSGSPINVVNEDDRIGRSSGRIHPMVLRREVPAKTPAGLLLQRVTLEEAKRSRPVAHILVGTGKDQGVVHEVLIDPKPDGRFDLKVTLISEKQVAGLRALAPLIANETKAQSALRSISMAQRRFQMRDKAQQYADSIESLASLLYEKELKEGTSPGYLLVLRRSPDGQTWMAVAVPTKTGSGRTGRFHYVTNNEGSTFRSKKVIELDDSCKIPTGLEQVR